MERRKKDEKLVDHINFLTLVRGEGKGREEEKEGEKGVGEDAGMLLWLSQVWLDTPPSHGEWTVGGYK